MTVPDPPNPPAVPPATTAVVFAGGHPLDAGDHARLRSAVAADDASSPLVIAADSGLALARTGGWTVDLVVGDLDSVDPGDLASAQSSGTRVERHPAAKNATDLELALDAALGSGVERVLLAGGHGGRLDHALANVFLLGSDRYASLTIAAVMGPAWLHVVRAALTWPGERGDLVTLLALHGAASGVTTTGLLYPLDRATLHAGSTRGVSNEQVDAVAGVLVESGVLIVVRPGERGTHAGPTDPDGAGGSR